MRLQDLPCSILRQILNGKESSWCSIELWKCGDRALSSRLANKGVTEIWLKDTDSNSTSRWPRCLREFALERLSVDRGCYGALGKALTLQLELKSLSPSLKSLKIVCRRAARAFFCAPVRQFKIDNSNDDLCSSMPDAKRPKYTEASDDEPHRVVWNLDTTWPQLERLVIRTSFSDAAFGISLLGLLPRSLTSFAFNYCFEDGALQDLSYLPPGLQTLSLGLSAIGLAALETLPKSLTHIGDSLCDEALHELFKRPNLLPNLIDFPTLCSNAVGDKHVALVHRDGYDWPDAFRRFPFTYVFNDTLFQKLPPKLVFLQSNAKRAHTTLRSRYIAGLPRTLETLKLYHLQWEGIRVQNWPQNLTRLSLRSVTNFSARCFSLLPRSLILFEFERPIELSEAEARALKKLRNAESVEELKALGRESLELDAERWSVEKARLLTPRYLALGSEAYIKRVEEGELFGLPLTLTKLDLCAKDHPFPYHLLLPPNVQSYSMSASIDDPNSLALLPPADRMHLRATLYQSRNDLKYSLQGFSNASPSESALCRSNLHSLAVVFDTPALPRPPLDYLPSRLQELTIRGPIFLRHAELETLPSNLEILSFGFSLAQPREPWTRLIPRGLTSLNVGTPIFGHDIHNLPSNLRSIKAPFYSVTLAQARTLPPRLSTIAILHSDNRVDAEEFGLLCSFTWNALQHLCRPFWRIREFSESYLQAELEIESEKQPRAIRREYDFSSKEFSLLFPTVGPNEPQFYQFRHSHGDDQEDIDCEGADDDSEAEGEGEVNDDFRGTNDAGDAVIYRPSRTIECCPDDFEEDDAEFVCDCFRPPPVYLRPSAKVLCVKLPGVPSKDADPRTLRRFATVTQ